MAESDLRFRNRANELDLKSLVSKLKNDENDTLLNDKQQQTNSYSSSLSFENACWFIGALTCLYISDILNVILSDERIHRSLMTISFALISVNILIALYMVIYLTKIKKILSNKWNEHNPILIPLATACFICGSLL